MSITEKTLVNPRAPSTAGTSGALVQLRRSMFGRKYVIVGEAYSPPLFRGSRDLMTLWVVGNAVTDKFRIEGAYDPEFDTNDDFDPGASSWAQVGNDVTLSIGRLIVSQTFNDLAYAFRIARLNGPGVPTAGDFSVYLWMLGG